MSWDCSLTATAEGEPWMTPTGELAVSSGTARSRRDSIVESVRVISTGSIRVLPGSQETGAHDLVEGIRSQQLREQGDER